LSSANDYFGSTLLGRSAKHDPMMSGPAAQQDPTLLGFYAKHDPMMLGPTT